jgi:hypothetical protein
MRQRAGMSTSGARLLLRAYALGLVLGAVACRDPAAAHGDAAQLPERDAQPLADAAAAAEYDAAVAVEHDASAAVSCSYVPVSAGARKLGMDILDVNQGETFDDNLAHAQAAHASYLTLHLPWTAIEISSGAGEASGTLVDPGTPPALSTFAALAQSSGMKLSLTLRPIDATGKTVPADLAALDFDDPIVVKRFERVIDFVLTRIAPEHLVNLMVGNEVDGFDPGNDTDFWIEYAALLSAVRTYVNASHPGLPLGFTATLPGLVDPERKTRDGWPTRETLRAWAEQVDVVGVTYYPLHDDFTMRAPSVAAADFTALVASVPSDKPIHIQELGYASSASVSASEALQAQFYCEALHAWDERAERIRRLAVLRLNDVSEAKAEALAGPYGVSTPAFIEYLRTLGLRTASGVAKPAYELLVQQAGARGL